MRRSIPLASALLLAPILLGSCSSTDAPAAANAPIAAEREAEPPITAEEALAQFDAVWTIIRDQHFDPTLGGLDWDAVREELRPRAEAAETRSEVRGVVRDMLERLGQSHFVLIPGELAANAEDEEEGDIDDDPADVADTNGGNAAAPRAEDVDVDEDHLGGVGLDMRWRDGRLLVTRVDAGSPAYAAGIRLGWSVLSVRGREVEDTLRRLEGREAREVAAGMRQIARERTFGTVGSQVDLVVEDAEGEVHELELVRAPRDVRVSSFGNLPEFNLEFREERLTRGGRDFGLIHFSNWFLPVAQPIDEAVDDLRDVDGMILDLRGNGGGALALVMGVAGHFFEERQAFGEHMQRDQTLTYRANPRFVNRAGESVTPFGGPLAILVDETSGSASEVFAGGLQSVGRARVFGETSMGAVLPSRTTELPGGDVLLHAFADFKTPDGTHLEGRGVVPDEAVPLRREDLLEGRDPQLEAALRWLADTHS